MEYLTSYFIEKVQQRLKNISENPNIDDVLNNKGGLSDFIEEYIPFKSLPNENWTQGYRGSAQFLVHRSLIRNLPKKFYENLYRWIINTNLSSALTGRYLEWTWHLFWYIYPKFILGTY